MTVDYECFVAKKVDFTASYGYPITDTDIHPLLLPHQRAIVRWAVEGGRRAIFAAFGLGKTMMQLETVRLTLTEAGGRGLIVCPLGVRQEFRLDAEKLGITTRFVRWSSEITDENVIWLTNYESIRDGRLDPALFSTISLDEAAVLRSYGSKTFQTFLDLCRTVPHRFVATATPSPNRYKELIHYAGFLGIMDTGQALTRFFKRDSTKANHLTLYPHKEQEFWLWLASWAIFLQSPADLGFDATRYVLPEIDIRFHEIEVDKLANLTYDRLDGQGIMIRAAELSIIGASREKRSTLDERVQLAAEIVASDPTSHFILWHDLEDERRALKKAIPETVEVYGALDLEERERRIIEFSDGKSRILATKPVLSGSGCNFQRHCHRAIFVGVGFKFNDFIQAVHRIHRFMQTEQVIIDIIHADTERAVVKTLMSKWAAHKELTSQMSELIREHGLSAIEIDATLKRAIGIERIEASGEGWIAANNDCVEETKLIETDTVGLIVTSIPFSNHYEYTPNYNDFGHTDNNDHFWAQMDYLTPELLRVLSPGRMYACHVKDRVLFGNVTGKGSGTISPFHAEAIVHSMKHGFDYMGMITITTDVVRENNQTYRLSWGRVRQDATSMGVGSPEYVLLFRKPQSDRSQGWADQRVEHTKDTYPLARWQVDAHAYWRSDGDRPITAADCEGLTVSQIYKLFAEQTSSGLYDFEAHVKIGETFAGMNRLPTTFMLLAPGSNHPDVWTDVNRMLTFNTSQAQKGAEQHVCLARGSLILTKNKGHIPIENVQIGDLVLTHKGRWQPVIAKQKTADDAPVVQVLGQGIPGLTLTPGHKLWARQVPDTVSAAAHSRKVAMTIEPDWLEAKAVQGSYVNLKLPSVEWSAPSDPDIWWLVGRWLADGHIDARGGAVISCGAHKHDELAARLGDRCGTFRGTGTSLQVLIKDKDRALRSILDRCGRGAANKHLPPEAYTLPTELAAELLAGYLSGDGHYRADRRRWMASSISKPLMLDMAFLAQRSHGAIASVYPGRPARTGMIQGRTVNMQADWIMSFDLPEPGRPKGLPFIMEDGAWKKVRSVEDAGLAETWNLRVAVDESYTAEGCIVKNCPLQFDIVDRLIERYSNEGDLIYDPFGGLQTVPVRALRAGRRGRGAELNYGYWCDGVKYLQAEEHRQTIPSLFDVLDAVNS